MDKRSIIERFNSHNENFLCVELQEESIKGGLYQPTAIKEKRYKRLMVIKDLDSEVLENDIVFIPTHAGTQIEDDGLIYTIVNKKDILMLDRDAN